MWKQLKASRCSQFTNDFQSVGQTSNDQSINQSTN